MLWPLEYRLEAGFKSVSHYSLGDMPKAEFIVIPQRDGILQEASSGEYYWRESPETNDEIFEYLDISRSRYPQIWHAVSLGLENAFWRGNKNDPNLEVDVRIYCVGKGKMIRIEDSGHGFDYQQKITDFFAGRSYAIGKGSGFKALHQESLIKAGYEGRGNVLNIAILK